MLMAMRKGEWERTWFTLHFRKLYGHMVLRLTSQRWEGTCKVMWDCIKAGVAELERRRFKNTLRMCSWYICVGGISVYGLRDQTWR
jgi:hypothetical protein